jgi:hypothetical protein
MAKVLDHSELKVSVNRVLSSNNMTIGLSTITVIF